MGEAIRMWYRWTIVSIKRFPNRISLEVHTNTLLIYTDCQHYQLEHKCRKIKISTEILSACIIWTCEPHRYSTYWDSRRSIYRLFTVIKNWQHWCERKSVLPINNGELTKKFRCFCANFREFAVDCFFAEIKKCLYTKKNLCIVP